MSGEVRGEDRFSRISCFSASRLDLDDRRSVTLRQADPFDVTAKETSIAGSLPRDRGKHRGKQRSCVCPNQSNGQNKGVAVEVVAIICMCKLCKAKVEGMQWEPWHYHVPRLA